MYRKLFVLAVVCCCMSFVVDKPAPKIILAILAHPDDESAIAPVLTKYARTGAKVHLVISTDGRYGVEEHAGIPAGDSLAKVRKQESICACKVLGIEPPVFMELHDGMGILTHLGAYFKQTAELKEKLKNYIESLRPDLIITFGPDGDTGHPDHRAISDITTELILREGWAEKYPLYYFGWLKEKVVSIPQGKMTSLNYADKKYMNVRISYTKEDRDKLFTSLNCYKSQITKKGVQDWIDAELKDDSFIFYFRRFVVTEKMQTEF